MSVVANLANEVAGEVPVMFQTWGYGAVALALFLVFGFVTWTYRDVANRHNHKIPAQAADSHDDHGQLEH